MTTDQTSRGGHGHVRATMDRAAAAASDSAGVRRDPSRPYVPGKQDVPRDGSREHIRSYER